MRTLFLLLTGIFAAGFFAPAFAGRVLTEEYESAAVTVPAGKTVHSLPSKFYEVPVDGYMVSGHWSVINAPTYALHHAWALTLEGNNYLCNGPGSAIFATGRESQRMLQPSGHPLSKEPYGNLLRKGQRFEIGRAVMFHNEDTFDYVDAKVRLTVTYYVPDPGDVEPKDMDFLMLNLGPPPHLNANFWCANLLRGGNNSEYMIPPKTTKTDRWQEDLVVSKPFEALVIGTHAHDFVDHIKLIVNDKPVWEANLVQDHDGHLVEIPFSYGPGLKFEPGDRLNIEAKYTNPLDRPVDAMAFIFLIYEDQGGPVVEVPEIPSEPIAGSTDTDTAQDHHHH